VVIVSPEILNNDVRFEDLWGTKIFTDNLINLVLDEAHVIKEWGGTFRSDYLRIGPIHYLLNRNPPVGFHLGTATMPPSRIDEIMANLHLCEDHTSIFRLSTDRPNIFFAMHKILKIYALLIYITAYYGILCLLRQPQLWELNHLVGTP